MFLGCGARLANVRRHDGNDTSHQGGRVVLIYLVPAKIEVMKRE
jgi:hypothetical protein